MCFPQCVSIHLSFLFTFWRWKVWWTVKEKWNCPWQLFKHFCWVFNLKNTHALLGYSRPLFFPKFQPRQGENPQTLDHIAAPAVFNIFACNTELSKPFSRSSHTYGDPSWLLLWCAGMLLLCEELERSSPGAGVDKNFWGSLWLGCTLLGSRHHAVPACLHQVRHTPAQLRCFVKCRYKPLFSWDAGWWGWGMREMLWSHNSPV